MPRMRKEERRAFFRSNRRLPLFITMKFGGGEVTQQIQLRNYEEKRSLQDKHFA